MLANLLKLIFKNTTFYLMAPTCTGTFTYFSDNACTVPVASTSAPYLATKSVPYENCVVSADGTTSTKVVTCIPGMGMT